MEGDTLSNFVVIKISKGTGNFASDAYIPVPVHYLLPPDKNNNKGSNKRSVIMMEGPHKMEDLQFIKDAIRLSSPIPPNYVPMECDVLDTFETLREAGLYIMERQGKASNANTVRTKPSVEASLMNVPKLLPKAKTVKAIPKEPIVPSSPPDTVGVLSEVVTVPEPVLFENVPFGVSQVPNSTAVMGQTHESTSQLTEVFHEPSTHSATPINNVTSGVVLGSGLLASQLKQGLEAGLSELNKTIQELSNYVKDKLPALEAKTNVLQKDMDELKTFVLTERKLAFNEDILTMNDFKNKYNLTLPMIDMEAFESFNDQLVEKDPLTGKVIKDSELFRDLNKHLTTTASRRDGLITCRQIFKDFFTKNVLLHVTSENLSPDGEEKIMKNTHFFRCLEDAFMHIFGATVTKELPTFMKTVINTGRDWGGREKRKSDGSTNPRKRRSNQRNEENDENNILFDIQPNDTSQ